MGRMIELTAADGFVMSAYRADPPGEPRGGDVAQRGIGQRPGLQLPAPGDVGRRVTDVHAALVAVEQRRRDHEVAVGGKPVADAADVAVDAEDLLRDDDRSARRADRIRAPCRQPEAVTGGEFDETTH